MNEQENFQAYLQTELLRRCRNNPKYSLRAFARTLAAEPSFLSKILNGKRVVTERTLKRFAVRLHLTADELERFQAPLTRGLRAKCDTASRRFVSLEPDRFRIISEWHHFAILELFRLPDFELTSRAVSRMLGITVIEAKDAIARLKLLGMLPDFQNGKSKPSNHTTLGIADTTVAYRALQKQILEMAVGALDDIPVEERDQSSMTLAIDRKILPEARRRIREFRRSLDRFAQSSGIPDSVYHLSISLYPVTQNKKGRFQ